MASAACVSGLSLCAQKAMKIMVCVNLAPLKLKRKWRARTVQIKLHANKLILVHFRFVLIR